MTPSLRAIRFSVASVLIAVACGFVAPQPVAPQTQTVGASGSKTGLRVARLGRFQKGVFVMASFERRSLREFALAPDTATLQLKDGRQFPVTAFVFPVTPSLVIGQEEQPFNTSRILTSAKQGAKMVRQGGGQMHQIADIQPLGLDSAPLFCGTRFLGDSVYAEMAFDLPPGVDLADVESVRVLDFPPTPIPPRAVVDLWPVHQGGISIDNKLGRDVLVRVLGPTENALIVRDGRSESLRAAPGSYHLRLRYGESDRQTYVRGEPFDLTPNSSKPASTTITLDDRYKLSPLSGPEFDRDPSVCPPVLIGEQR